MGAKGWIIFSAVTVAVLGALIYFSGQNKIDVSQFDTNSIIQANETSGNIGDHIKGTADSKVLLVEYGDFQCPGCAGAATRVQAIVEEYEDRIAFVFRNLPLASMHPHARAAAAAAEAAGMQDQYWEMHYLLFEKQAEWSSKSVSERTTVFEGYARSLGLDIERFRTDFASESINQKINFDLAVAKEKGYTGTPTFELNGEEVDQDVWGDDEALRTALDEALAKAGVSTESKTED